MSETDNTMQSSTSNGSAEVNVVNNDLQQPAGEPVVQQQVFAGQGEQKVTEFAQNDERKENKTSSANVDLNQVPTSLFFDDDNDKDLQDFRTRADKVFTKEEQDEFSRIAKERGLSKTEANRLAKLYVKQREDVLADPNYTSNCEQNDIVATSLFGIDPTKGLKDQDENAREFYKIYQNLNSTAEGARFLNKFSSFIKFAAQRVRASSGDSGAVSRATTDTSVKINGSNFNSFQSGEREKFLASVALGKIKDTFLSPQQANSILTSIGWK